MAHIDTGDRALYDAVGDVRDESSETNWVVITYAPQRDNPAGNKLKVQATGNDFEDLRDEFDEGRAQFALLRVRVKEIFRYVFISWCGEGVQGMQKGRFGDHSVDMERWIAPFHVQINARCPDDVDLDKIILPRVYKALGADYDASGAKDQSVQREGRFNASSYNQKEDITAMQQKSAAFWSAPESKASVQGSGYNKDTSFQQTAGASAKKNAFEDLAKPAPQPEIQRTGRTFQPPKPAPAPAPAKPAAAAPRPYQQAKAAPPAPTNRAAPAPAPVAAAPPPVQSYHQEEPEEDNWDEEPAAPQHHYEEPAAVEQHHYEEPAAQQDEGYYDEGQGGYDEGQGGYDEGQGGYDEGQGGYDQGGYDQGGYDQGGYDQGGQGYLRQVTASYDYVGEGEDDLSFYAGDVINVIDDSDPSGWYRGELNGAVGVFPSNFVEESY